ncbi:major facilitator superfamily transporter [Nocardia nova SH22a]|uniref:Major facilitator superfamily transporter n=1 Tax=Nocardia nova SH22a TaxID=1415166 RepID=W5TIP4_9NOCA|nr:MFS transporter [Nocardia nova]AHH19024.1 major facilitator superfamily transporter [Nocardia nova SH22a]
MNRTGSGRPGLIVGVLAFAGIIASIMQTLVIPLIAQFPQLLHTTASNASWIVTVTLLVGAVTTPVAGRLGDLYGKRRVLLLSTVPLIAGSIVCALSDSVLPMIIGRGLQGMGVGIIPLGISVMRDVLPAEKLGSAVALLSASLGIGGALGLPVSAAVAEYSDWHVLFWGAAVLSAVIAVAVWLVVPESDVRGRGGFDYVGAAGLGAGLVALLLAVSKGGTWGWGSGTTVGLFAAAVVVLLAWGWWELRVADPLVDLRVTARPPVLLTNAASVVIGVAMYSSSLIVPQVLQLPTAAGYGLGQSMMAMGLWMAPSGLMMMAISPVGARLSALRGPKVTLTVGALVIAAGYGVTTALMGSTWGLLIAVCVINGGVGLAYGAMPALIMSSVPLSETASANSFNTLMRSIGTSVAAAVVGVVLAQMSMDFHGHSVPTEGGFRTGLFIGCGVALIAAALAAAIPVRRRSTPDEVAESAEPVAVRG